MHLFSGIVIPILMIGYGVGCCVSKSALWLGSGFYSGPSMLRLSGSQAVAAGAGLIALGFALHLHLVWRRSTKWFWLVQIGEIVAVLFWLLTMSFLFYRIIVRTYV